MRTAGRASSRARSGAWASSPGERVGTLAWNGYRHFELYYGVSGIEAIIHTINPRLFFEQLVYIVTPRRRPAHLLRSDFPASRGEARAAVSRRHDVDRAHRSRAHAADRPCPIFSATKSCWRRRATSFDWPEFDEKTAAGLCYTSGTTGNPKGVLFSHRSTLLHAYAVSLPDAKGYSAHSTVLPVVPMFHVNAWGIPYAAALCGAKLVLPGAGMDGASLYELFETEEVESSAGVPTVWLNLIKHLQDHRLKFTTLKYATIGGAAVPPAMVRTLTDDFGLKVLHGWGMTEMSPVGTINTDKAKHRKLSGDDRFQLSLKQGRPLPGVEMKLVDPDGAELPWDGKSAGNLLVRGPWVVREYYRDEGGSPLTADGWFPTGDVGTIDPDGYLQITDRSKDMIKSGGEWISSIELENIAVSHPAVAEAAVIGVRHPRWSERPLLLVVRKEGASVDRDAMLAFYEGKVAKWSAPDDVVFVDELPHTATGKLSKRTLREQFKDYRLPTA